MWKISIKLLMTLESLKDVKIKRRLKGIILMFNIIIKETEKSVILKIPRSVKRKGDTFTPSYTIKLFTKLKYYLYRSGPVYEIRKKLDDSLGSSKVVYEIPISNSIVEKII